MNDFNIRMFNPQPEPPGDRLMVFSGMPPATNHAERLQPGVYVEEVSFRRK